MVGTGINLKNWIARNRHSALAQYGAAALAVWVTLSLWTFAPVLHRHLFVLLLAAVLFSARFLGFGPAVFWRAAIDRLPGLFPAPAALRFS